MHLFLTPCAFAGFKMSPSHCTHGNIRFSNLGKQMDRGGWLPNASGTHPLSKHLYEFANPECPHLSLWTWGGGRVTREPETDMGRHSLPHNILNIHEEISTQARTRNHRFMNSRNTTFHHLPNSIRFNRNLFKACKIGAKTDSAAQGYTSDSWDSRAGSLPSLFQALCPWGSWSGLKSTSKSRELKGSFGTPPKLSL